MIPGGSVSEAPEGQSAFSSLDLALTVGVSRSLVRRYLRSMHGHAHELQWVRLDAEQFERARLHLLELKAANPQQPLRGFCQNSVNTRQNHASQS